MIPSQETITNSVLAPAFGECGLAMAGEMVALAHLMTGELMARRSERSGPPSLYTAGPTRLLPALEQWDEGQLCRLLCHATPRGANYSLTMMRARFEALPAAIDRALGRLESAQVEATS